jgi:galactonate dehydratase
MSNLRITDIKAIMCGPLPITKVYTNEGITGLGENVVNNPGIFKAQVEMLKGMLVGEDPFKIEWLWIKMMNQTSFSYMNSLISAVDCALYDIKGKALGIPVYELLGGLYRRHIRLYPHLRGTWNSFPDPTQDDLFSEPWGEVEYTPEQLGQHAKELVNEGYTAMKFDPFRPGRDGYHGYRPDEIDAVVERVAAIRAAVGPAVDLMVECHGKFNAGTAIKIGKKLEQFDLFWYEEPVPVGMVTSMKKVADHVNIPIAACERLNNKLDLKEYLEAAAVDVVMFDVGKVGGLTEAMKICALCETYQAKAAPHNPFGPVAAIANAHLSAAVHPFLIQEHEQMAPWAVEPRLKIVDGYLEVSDRPGFGIELNDDEIAAHNAKVADGTYKSFSNAGQLDFTKYVPVL